jgi:hypothetical protein
MTMTAIALDTPPRLADAPDSRQLMTELQSQGLRLVDPSAGASSRRGGAGPSDHKAVTVDGVTLMVPVHTATAFSSPFVADAPGADGVSVLRRGSIPIASIRFPTQPRFYGLSIADGIPYQQIATLHGADVLATTVLQTCIRYESRRKACKFCAIGQSLAAGRTIAHKTPDASAVGRGGEGGGGTRRRETHGHDHGHTAHARPRCAHPVRERTGDSRGCGPAAAGAM